MIFNEYTSILEDGDVYFLDEENLYQLMLEATPRTNADLDREYEAAKNNPVQKKIAQNQAANQGKAPANGLTSNDSTATTTEQQKDPNAQQQPSQNEQQQAQGLIAFFKAQGQKFTQFCSDQSAKLGGRLKNLGTRLGQAPQNYNGPGEAEVSLEAPEIPPDTSFNGGDDPSKWQQFLGLFKRQTQEYNEKSQKKSGVKTVLKGAALLIGGKTILNHLSKMSFQFERKTKDGSTLISFGGNKASQGAQGKGFLGSLGLIIKNVFLAVLVLIGGIFKVIKEYLVGLGKIIGAIFGTVAAAGQTLVTGKMPAKA